jgi:hypothetical protein
MPPRRRRQGAGAPCLRRGLALGCLAAALAGAAMPAFSRDETVTGDKGSDMAVDLVLVRPVGLVATAVGALAWVIALPFTLPTGSADDAAREMVSKPAEYTFDRRLGEFHRCGEDRHPCGYDAGARR